MSRPVERIPRVLEAVSKVWTQKPDLRLGQLLLAASGTRDLFYMEDDTLIDALKDFAKNYP